MTMLESPMTLDTAARQRLAAIADLLIPGGEGLPNASKVDVQGKWIDRALVAAPELAAVVSAVLAESGEPQEVIDRLQRDQQELFGGFAWIVSGAYLMHPKVRRALGYPGGAPKPNPPLPDESDFYLSGDILGPVVARGPIFKDVSAYYGSEDL